MKSLAIKFAALFLIAASTFSSAGAQEFKAGTIAVSKPWSRATPQGAKVGVGYLEITNRGDAPDRLVSLSTATAGRSEIHEMVMREGVMHMRPLAEGLTVAPGQTVKLAPGGLHLMFVDLAGPLKQGQKLDATLIFERAGKLDITFSVEALGARAPGAGAGSHHHH